MNLTTCLSLTIIYIFIGTLISALGTDEDKPLNMGMIVLWPIVTVGYIFLVICASFYALTKRINKALNDK